jgi:hypothetical protein
MPRLPAEDKLAALHEIATSPLSYAPGTAINSSRPVASGGPQHKKPRLMVDVMEGQAARKTSASTTPTSQLLDAIGTPHSKDVSARPGAACSAHVGLNQRRTTKHGGAALALLLLGHGLARKRACK